jgi:integrase
MTHAAPHHPDLQHGPMPDLATSVVRYLILKGNLRSIEDVRRICRKLDPTLGHLMLDQINGDVVHKVIEDGVRAGRKTATINRYLATIRSLLGMARDEWQWVDTMRKTRLLSGEAERDRWLTPEEAARLIAPCAPHRAAMVRFALATGCRAREIVHLEWEWKRVDLKRGTA